MISAPIPEAINALQTGLTYAPNDPQALTMLQQLQNATPPAP